MLTHVWVGQRQGGSPSEESSCETVEWRTCNPLYIALEAVPDGQADCGREG